MLFKLKAQKYTGNLPASCKVYSPFCVGVTVIIMKGIAEFIRITAIN